MSIEDSTEVFAYSRVLEWGSPFGLVNFAKPRSKLPIFNNCSAHFSVGKVIYWVGNFGQWAG